MSRMSSFLQEQTSKGQAPGNVLVEGAVTEVKAKIRILRYELESCLSRAMPESHDTVAWLVQHAAATINWHRTGVDGRTPFQRRTGKSFRRVVAPFGQKVMWMATGKDSSRVGAESRWREGSFLGTMRCWSRCRRLRRWDTRWCGGGRGDQARDQTTVLGTWSCS